MRDKYLRCEGGEREVKGAMRVGVRGEGGGISLHYTSGRGIRTVCGGGSTRPMSHNLECAHTLPQVVTLQADNVCVCSEIW